MIDWDSLESLRSDLVLFAPALVSMGILLGAKNMGRCGGKLENVRLRKLRNKKVERTMELKNVLIYVDKCL